MTGATNKLLGLRLKVNKRGTKRVNKYKIRRGRNSVTKTVCGLLLGVH
jgi:hypothetical protein